MNDRLFTYRQMWVRLAHINAPELRELNELWERDLVQKVAMRAELLLRGGKPACSGPAVNGAEGTDVGQQLIVEGLARAYEGGRR